jgi:hypothetical protein
MLFSSGVSISLHILPPISNFIMQIILFTIQSNVINDWKASTRSDLSFFSFPF